MPDAATASAALQNGEQDWLEFPAWDLVDLLRRSSGITVKVQDPTGLDNMMRPNHLQPLFNNPGVRRALLWGIDPSGRNAGRRWRSRRQLRPAAWGVLSQDTDGKRRRARAAAWRARDPARAKKLLKQAGYAGEKAVLLVPSDYVTLKAVADAMAVRCRAAA